MTVHLHRLEGAQTEWKAARWNVLVLLYYYTHYCHCFYYMHYLSWLNRLIAAAPVT
jgi:hypothetical protein